MSVRVLYTHSIEERELSKEEWLSTKIFRKQLKNIKKDS